MHLRTARKYDNMFMLNALRQAVNDGRAVDAQKLGRLFTKAASTFDLVDSVARRVGKAGRNMPGDGQDRCGCREYVAGMR